MPITLTFVAFLAWNDGTKYRFQLDDEESRKKAEEWGLPDVITLGSKWSLADYMGKRVRITVRCSRYKFESAGGTTREGVRVTGLVDIKIE